MLGAATSDPSDAKKKEKKNSHLYISERAGPANMLISDFELPEERRNSCCDKPPSLVCGS